MEVQVVAGGIQSAEDELIVVNPPPLPPGWLGKNHALNELAGETVFAGQLPAFFQRFPKFAPLQEKTEDFFKISQQLFFTKSTETVASISIEQIESLCLLYRKLERGSRWS